LTASERVFLRDISLFDVSLRSNQAGSSERNVAQGKNEKADFAEGSGTGWTALGVWACVQLTQCVIRESSLLNNAVLAHGFCLACICVCLCVTEFQT
jgi:hypothetical protein